MLLMARPYTDPAYNAVATAGSGNDSSTPGQPLGNRMHGATDPPHAPIALQRWESDDHAAQADELGETPRFSKSRTTSPHRKAPL
jgi:hypothetical protein